MLGFRVEAWGLNLGGGGLAWIWGVLLGGLESNLKFAL